MLPGLIFVEEPGATAPLLASREPEIAVAWGLLTHQGALTNANRTNTIGGIGFVVSGAQASAPCPAGAKTYGEMVNTAWNGSGGRSYGVRSGNWTNTDLTAVTPCICYNTNGFIYKNGVFISGGHPAFTANSDVIGVYCDDNTGAVSFSFNGVRINGGNPVGFMSLADRPYWMAYSTGIQDEAATCNFNSLQWAYLPPFGWRGVGAYYAPTDISLTTFLVTTGLPTGVTVATFVTTDPNNPADVFTYTLLDDAGGRFQVSGNALQTGATARGTAGTTYNITVRVTDLGGLTFTKTLTLTMASFVYATLNPTDKSAELTLTSLDRHVARNSLASVWASARATQPINAGDKFYFEMVADDISGHSQGLLPGFATSAAAILSSYPGSVVGSVGYQINNALWGNVGGGSFPAVVSGGRYGWAIDFDARKFWLGTVTGSVVVWAGSGNPATNFGGSTIIDATMVAAANWYFAIALVNQVAMSATLYTNPADLLAAPPAGFNYYTS